MSMHTMEFLEFIRDQGNLLVSSALQILGLIASGLIGKRGPQSIRVFLFSGSLLICLSLLSFPVMLFWRYTTDWFGYRPGDYLFKVFEYTWILGIALQLIGVALLAQRYRGVSEQLEALEEMAKAHQEAER